MLSKTLLTGVLGLASCIVPALAQDFATHGTYTEPVTGIKFYTSYEQDGIVEGDGEFSTVSEGGFVHGIALPPDAATKDSYSYLGLIIGSTPRKNGGWTGIVHGDNLGAGMPNHLMLIAWPTGVGNQIATSLRYAPAYQPPTAYQGTAKVSTLYSSVNATNWVLVYRCDNCYLFDDPTQTPFNMSTKVGRFEQGWAQSFTKPQGDITNPNAAIGQHDNGMGEMEILVASATQASYSIWATQTVTGVVTATGTAIATSTASAVPVPTGTTYDYVVIGGGAGGIPMADKLSAAGKSVLLIEKGYASSARWGGTIRPPLNGSVDLASGGWLDGQNLTWFDIPGECNRIWNGGSTNVACTDTDQMAGCILGGGTAVNAGLWWKANPKDWDYDFPTGWKSGDMLAPTNRVFNRIPGTDHPSMDGKRYVQSGFDTISSGLANAGWTSVTANDAPGQKNRTYAHTAYMYIGGERAGPMATYLVSANGRNNFHMWLNTSVERINRVGGHATSLDVSATWDGGRSGVVQLTPNTGRVIVSAGTFGTAKLLFRSGIGPTDMLETVKASTDGPKMINQSDWINLPVGYNLLDHLNTDCVVSHPNVSYYDWPKAWTDPDPTDAKNYLTNRTGPLAQAAPNIGPMMWEEITGPDGIVRQMQWTSRVEGSSGIPNGNSMTLSLYLGRGELSRGRTTIGRNLNMVVSQIPYGDKNDLAAVAMAIDSMVASLKNVPNITFNLPPLNMTGAQYLASIPLTAANVGARRSNHWMGSAKMGLDSGLVNNGTSVVDTNTKVYGTDNIFVVDASIFPGLPSTNPSAYIVAVAEHASDKILALAYPGAKPSGSSSSTLATSTSKSSTIISTSSVKPSSTSTKSSSAPTATATAPAGTIPQYGTCGGIYWGGSGECAPGLICRKANDYYSQCVLP